MTNCFKLVLRKKLALLAAVFVCWFVSLPLANALNLAQSPLYLTASQPPLIMMTMARDHKLYYEAYNDYSDLNGDGTLDIYYTPAIEYFGYFDSYKCYNYAGGKFTPVSVTANKKCTGSDDAYWSGDFLNYVTTSRMDAIRKVFYGGKRGTDTSTQTILERSFIPQDAHSWGKEYLSIARDGYDIREYTPLSLPVTGYRHLFVNTTLTSDTSPPLLRVLNDSVYRIWEWVSIERPVAGADCVLGLTRQSCETAAGGWSIVPSSSTHGLSSLTQTTYNTGAVSSPANEVAFNAFESTYGVVERKCGSAAASTIDGSGNPFKPGTSTKGSCTDDYYMTIFSATLNISTAATYIFGIDGDDAVDLIIDSTQRVGWYGDHGKTGSPPTHTASVTLSAGAHTLKFRHHEQVAEDSYHLYWQVTPASVITDYNVRVEVCKTITGVSATYNEGREANCQGYGTSPVSYKPTGLLHKYGQNNGMYFGLLTGSYDQNTDGGVLRKEVSSITNEIEASTGIYKETGSTCGLTGATACIKGIVGTIDRLKVTSFHYSDYTYPCGWITTRAMNNGECEMWGNPLGEMMYEGLRYFAGKTAATGAYTTSSTRDDALGLPRVTWNSSTNPYGSGKYPSCAKPYFMLISDVYPSFDSDKIPGADSNFGALTGDIAGLNVRTMGQTIWDIEFGASAAKNIFIGQVGSSYDGAPTVKTATSFGNIRGLSPSEPTRQGSYYPASIAYFGKINDLNAAAGGQRAFTYAIALAPPLPKIEIAVGANKVVLVPFAKSVGGFGISASAGSFQPTNQIVDFYIDTINNTTAGNANSLVNSGRPYYKFRINYEDVEQGADHDMDAIVTYEVKLNADNTITVSLSSDYAAGGVTQHMGYVVSGTTADGVYLEVRDRPDGAEGDSDYFLDTPNIAGTALPLTSSRTFTASSSPTAGVILNDPLWYAAKYGGFADANSNNIPETTEWDADGDGTPDNYFLVINPIKMLTQMDKALAKIRDDSGTSAALSTNSFSFQTDTLLFQTRFNSDGWSGELNAYPVSGQGIANVNWQAQQQLVSKSSSSRVILTYDLDKTTDRGIAFTWDAMSTASPATLHTSLNKTANGTADTLGSDRVTYLRGDAVTGMRTRPTISGTSSTNRLGDIVNSQAQYVGRPNFGYSEGSYATFSVSKANRIKMVYVGANDGMLHGFNAASGEELLGYVPSEMYRTRGTQQPLSKLTQADYGKTGNLHRFYVDGTPTMGDICTGSCTAADWKTILVAGLNAGGQGIYALDITNPGSFTQANASTIVKWEFLDHDHDGTTSDSTITGDADLGYTYSRPFVVKLCKTRVSSSSGSPKICSETHWYVIFGNGYNSTETDGYVGTGASVLYVLDADTGYLVRKIPLSQADGVSPNGLSELAPADIDGDGTIDYVYAGDLKGNLWRVDFVSDIGNNSWGTSTVGTGSSPNPLYIAKDEQSPTRVRQPITTAPDVIVHPQGGVLVIFGTGSYLETADTSTTQVQTMYGIWDKLDGNAIASTDRTNLQEQTVNTVIVSGTSTVSLSGGTSVNKDHDYRTVSANFVNWASMNGWYMNLPETGERVAFNPQVLGGNLLKFSSVIPSADVCESGGSSWDYYIDALTGRRLEWSVYSELAGLQVFGSTSAYASARKSAIGITPTGTILTEGQGRGTVFEGGSTGEMDYYKANLGPATAGRISWREILND